VGELVFTSGVASGPPPKKPYPRLLNYALSQPQIPFGVFCLRLARCDGASTNLSYQFDEFRMGSTWSQVVPTVAAIPEPSTVALISLGILGVGGTVLRRRRGLSK